MIKNLNQPKKEFVIFPRKNMTMAELIIYKYTNASKSNSFFQNGGDEVNQTKDFKTQPNDILILIFTGQLLKNIK
jgi:hypothetical protein